MKFSCKFPATVPFLQKFYYITINLFTKTITPYKRTFHDISFKAICKSTRKPSWTVYNVPFSYLICITSTKTNEIFTKVFPATVTKKRTKFSSYIRKFRWDRLQSYIWGRKSFLIYEEMRKYLTIYKEAVSPFWISLFMKEIWLNFFYPV